MRTQYLLILLGLLVLSAGCKKATKCIDGNGDLVQETRSIDACNTVNLYGNMHLFYSQGVNSRVDIFAESNIIPLINTTIHGQNILTVDVQEGSCYTTSHAPEVTLMTPGCYNINLFGSGNFQANSLNMDELKIASLGSGDINSSFDTHDLSIESRGSGNANFAGSTTNYLISLNGSGNIYSKTVIADSCIVRSDGSGDITINVTAFLDVIIKGSGNVYYSGDPVIVQNITGSGQLIKEGK